MTPNEFQDWLEGYLRVFPDFKAWFNELGPDDTIALQEEWANAMADVELRDAKAVTTRIICGDDPPVQPFERELTAAIVRRLSKENAVRRREREHKAKRKESPARSEPRGPGAGQLYREMLALMEANPDMSAHEAAEQVMPPAEDDLGGRRYDCYMCRDTGIVLVWSPVSIQAAIRGELDEPGNRQTCGAPCSCRAGDQKVWRNSGDPPRGWTGWRNPEAVYSSERYCLCLDGDVNNPREIEAFKDWVAERLLEAQTKKREPAFDNWNAGGGKDNALVG